MPYANFFTNKKMIKLPPFKIPIISMILFTLVGFPNLKGQSSQPSASAHFPTAGILAYSEENGATTDQKIRKKILKTNFKYPYIRTEEKLDAATKILIGKEVAMVADHILVTLAPGEKPLHFLQQLDLPGVSLEKVPVKAALYRLKLGSISLDAVPKALETITSKHLAVINSEPDYICSTLDSEENTNLPNDPLYKLQYSLWKSWSLLETGADSGIPFESGIDAERGWKIRNKAPSIIVAVIDSGIRYTHEDLAENMWHNANPVSGDLYGTNAVAHNGDPMDDEGHGTHCAGIIGAVGNNGVGITGVAWKVQLMACKFLDASGTGVISDEAAAIDYACNHGARILNCSFGTIIPSSVEKAAFDEARNHDIIVVVAAGNNHANNDENGTFYNLPSYPATYKLDNIVAVASTSLFSQLSTFSNYGAKTVHLAAPGEEIYSTWFNSDHSYHVDSGTSMAAPHVTGALALMMEQFPNLSYKQLIAHLLFTTDKLPELKEKTISGGRLNLYHALKWDPSEDPSPTCYKTGLEREKDTSGSLKIPHASLPLAIN